MLLSADVNVTGVARLDPVMLHPSEVNLTRLDPILLRHRDYGDLVNYTGSVVLPTESVRNSTDETGSIISRGSLHYDHHTSSIQNYTTQQSLFYYSAFWNFSWEFFNESFYNLSESTEVVAEEVDLSSAVLSGLALGFVILMTICGNILVLMAIFVNSHLRSTTNYFIANLAAADCLLGMTVLPFSASLEVVDRWSFGAVFCDVWAALDVLCCTASIMSLCVISIDRYIGVTRPLKHSTIMSEKRAGMTICSVWMLSILISVAPLLGWKDPPPPDTSVCEVTKQLGYVLFSVSGSFYIPLTIILVVYFRVYREALRQSKFLATGVKTSKSDEADCKVTLRIHTGRLSATKPNCYQSSSSSEHSQESGRKSHTKFTLAGKIAKFKREKKAAKTLGIVVGVFIMCWFPFFFILPLEALCTTCRIPEWLFKTIFWLGYCNSMMNPIIYACSSREFKRAFLRILRCQWRRRQRSFLARMISSNTEMTKLDRFNASLKKLTTGKNGSSSSRRHLSECRTRSYLGSNSSMYTAGKESPIVSLRLLQEPYQHGDQQPHQSICISDEDSVIHEITDEEISDFETESTISKYKEAISFDKINKKNKSSDREVELTIEKVGMNIIKDQDLPDIIIEEVLADDIRISPVTSSLQTPHITTGNTVDNTDTYHESRMLWV